MKNLSFILIILFGLRSFSQDSIHDSTFKCELGSFTSPEFPGGNKALMKFIKDSIQFPKTLINDDLCGRIIVKFQVDTLGFVQKPEILKDEIGDSSLRANVITVFKSIPKWKSGTELGKPANIYYTMPITFSPKEEK